VRKRTPKHCPLCGFNTKKSAKSPFVNPPNKFDEYVAAMRRGADEAFQDRCENCFLQAVGGDEAQASGEWTAPKYVEPHLHRAFIAGYDMASRAMWGVGIDDVKLTWSKAITIGGDDENGQ